MKNKNKNKNKNNIITFPSGVSKIERQVEAILFSASEPLDIETIEKRIQSSEDITKILEKIKDTYKSRGINLVCIKDRWSFRTAEDLSKLMSLQKSTQRKLSKAATETLSIIAYHQPVTRAEVEDIRGVHFSPGTLDVLMELNWVRPIGRKKVPGRPIIYGTTERFLEYFQLEQVSDLPGLEELKAAGLLESRLPPNLDIKEPQEVDQSQIEPFGEDENIDDLIQSGHEAE